MSREAQMMGIESLSPSIGVAEACRVMDVARATYYRDSQPQSEVPEQHQTTEDVSVENHKERIRSPRALSTEEEQTVLDLLHSERFMDKSPGQIYATLLDESFYVCSERTMYRILEKHGEVKERCNQLKHPQYKKPELVAQGPNEVWSWDITKMKGPVKWTYFYLYVILDIYSRYVVGWMVALRETAELAKHLIKETCAKHGIQRGDLTIHADRGSPMKAKSVALLMADLGVVKSHSRPRVSNDNPYSESQFKTMKYSAGFPERFGCVEDARYFCGGFLESYNKEHHHSGIGMMTPEVVHYGQAEHVRNGRLQVLQAAYEAHPERFVKGKPCVSALPDAVWINPPMSAQDRKE